MTRSTSLALTAGAVGTYEVRQAGLNDLTVMDDPDSKREDSDLIVSAVGLIPAVLTILNDAIERQPTREKFGETGYAVDALRLARAINGHALPSSRPEES